MPKKHTLIIIVHWQLRGDHIAVNEFISIGVCLLPTEKTPLNTDVLCNIAGSCWPGSENPSNLWYD